MNSSSIAFLMLMPMLAFSSDRDEQLVGIWDFNGVRHPIIWNDVENHYMIYPDQEDFHNVKVLTGTFTNYNKPGDHVMSKGMLKVSSTPEQAKVDVMFVGTQLYWPNGDVWYRTGAFTKPEVLCGLWFDDENGMHNSWFGEDILGCGAKIHYEKGCIIVRSSSNPKKALATGFMNQSNTKLFLQKKTGDTRTAEVKLEDGKHTIFWSETTDQDRNEFGKFWIRAANQGMSNVSRKEYWTKRSKQIIGLWKNDEHQILFIRTEHRSGKILMLDDTMDNSRVWARGVFDGQTLSMTTTEVHKQGEGKVFNATLGDNGLTCATNNEVWTKVFNITGAWRNGDGDLERIDIKFGKVIIWKDYDNVNRKIWSKGTFDGETIRTNNGYSATLNKQRLVWDDNDVWVRPPVVPETTL